jgi:predicted nucleic acid-binding protein
MTDSNAILMDSSGWVEAAGTGSRAHLFQEFLSEAQTIIVPTIVIFEVSKKLTLSVGKPVADRFISHAFRQHVVALNAYLALAAVELSIRHKLAMADAIIYATARSERAQLITSDSHFQGLTGVTII